MPPNNIDYPHPEAVGRGRGRSVAKIVGRAMQIERFPKWGDYMRILDLVEWQKDKHHKKPHKELRFCQFYRKAGGTNSDWIFGQGAGHMKPTTFYKLIRKAVTPGQHWGIFEGVFDKFVNKRVRRQRKT